MPLPDATGWVSQQQMSGLGAQPPQYVLDAIGGSYDQSRYYWNPENMTLVDRYTGGSYSYADIANPALGTDVVTNLSGYNANGPSDPGTFHFDPGVNPYIAFPGESYNGGLTPNSGLFLSADQQEIADYRSGARDRVQNGIGQVGALVGGMALGGALSGGSTAATGAQTFPYASGGAVTATPLAGGAAAAGGAAGVGGAAAAGGGGAVTNALTGAARNIPNWVTDYLLPGLNGLYGAYSANQASDAQVGAMDRAIEENRRQYDTTRGDLMPWLDAGRDALTQLNNPGNYFTQSPDYTFRRDEGTRGIENSFAARGGGQSGNALRALAEFNSGLASQEYGDWWNRQAGRAGVGQTTATTLGDLGADSSRTTGNYLANRGDARASGVLGRYAALSGAGSDVYQNYLYRRRAA